MCCDSLAAVDSSRKNKQSAAETPWTTVLSAFLAAVAAEDDGGEGKKAKGGSHCYSGGVVGRVDL